jgi:hypothetical protein
MYFVETGLGEVFKPRDQKKTPPTKQSPQPLRKVPPKAPPKGPPDTFLELYTHWDSWVPFRKDIKTFGQEVAKAIGRHVAGSEKTTVNSLLIGSRETSNLFMMLMSPWLQNLTSFMSGLLYGLRKPITRV